MKYVVMCRMCRMWLMVVLMLASVGVSVGVVVGAGNGGQVGGQVGGQGGGVKPLVKPKVGSYQAPVGIGRLSRRLGEESPTGRGITVGHVEGGAGRYLPDMRGGEFKNVNVVARSGASQYNGHTTSTARIIYGKKGLAPGVTNVLAYSSQDWLGPNYLGVGRAMSPRANNVRVFNHSWIGGGGASAVDALRRIDYLADRYEVLMVVGVNNGRNTGVPGMLGSGYNQISVGVISGNSSGGYTRIEGKGRCKPDVVATRGQTSFSTPMVTAVVARLLEANDRAADPRMSSHSEVIKACLMAGASKPGGWKQAGGKPLDEHLGAGSVRLDVSYDILMAGPVGPSEGGGHIKKRYGWDFGAAQVEQTVIYRFETMRALREVSIMLVWNRRIDGRVMTDLASGRKVWNNHPRLANFDLSLVLIDAYGELREIAASRSSVDNVEHLYFRALPAGEYEMRITRDDREYEAWDYALAWRMDVAREKKVGSDSTAGAGAGAESESAPTGRGATPEASPEVPPKASPKASPEVAPGANADTVSEVPPRRHDGTVLDLSGLIDPSKLDVVPRK